MKKFENSPLYRGFWGVQIAKHRKTAQITPFYPPERAWGFHGRWCRSVEPEGMDRIQDTLILYYIIYIHASHIYRFPGGPFFERAGSPQLPFSSRNRKHRTSLHETSVFSGQNIRTFTQRSPMFLDFRNVFVKREQKQCLH